MIYINSTLRIKVLDDRNLQLEEYRTGVAKQTGKKITRWYHCGYYGKLKEALIGALNKRLFDSAQNEMTINEVIAKIDEVRNEIMSAVDKLTSEGKEI